MTWSIRPLALLLALFLASAAAWAARPGDPAPEINLPRIYGERVSLAVIRSGGPVLVWFPEASSVSGQTGASLATAAARNGATLLVIPVVGADPGPAQALSDRFPDWLVLHDADGSVTLDYAGEFIPGISPRQNLFIVSTRGLVTWSRFWPGVPEQTLDNELRAAR